MSLRRPVSPQRTTASAKGPAPNPEFFAKLAHCHEHEAARRLLRNPSLVVGLGQPLAGKAGDYMGSLSAMQIECPLEIHVLAKRGKPLGDADMVWQLAGQVIVEVTSQDAREEVPRMERILNKPNNLA